MDETVRREGIENVVQEAVRVDVIEGEGWEALRRRLDGESDDVKEAFDLVLGNNFIHMIPCACLPPWGPPFLRPLASTTHHAARAVPEGPRRIFTSLLSPSLVSPSAKLLLYGPFKHDTGFFSPSDEAVRPPPSLPSSLQSALTQCVCGQFDKEISSRPSSYPLGLRSIDGLARLADETGWRLSERIGVAKGNWVLVFEQQEGRAAGGGQS